jgi:DNA-directed RNA polymerase subunit RPC12/RpoP
MTTENTEHTETAENGRNTKSDLRTGSAGGCPQCCKTVGEAVLRMFARDEYYTCPHCGYEL